MEDARAVPKHYKNRSEGVWWKYYIANHFPAYTPNEIHYWTVDLIMEHLAAITWLGPKDSEVNK